jgi:hypothetical protein
MRTMYKHLCCKYQKTMSISKVLSLYLIHVRKRYTTKYDKKDKMKYWYVTMTQLNAILFHKK